MQETPSLTARVIPVVAAVFVSLACGTNYAYSTWAPQFALKLGLTATESNLIGSFGNLGMYIPAIMVGIFVDAKGPRGPVISGAMCLGLGYIGIYIAFSGRPGDFSVPTLCFFSCLTGCGSCLAFLAALKTAAVNHPDGRGAATGFPLAAFGLSAFLVSSFSSSILRDDTSKLLLTLAISTFTINLLSVYFLRLLPPPNLDTQGQKVAIDSDVRHWRERSDRKASDLSTAGPEHHLQEPVPSSAGYEEPSVALERAEIEETSSLLSERSQESCRNHDQSKSYESQIDIRGLKLLREADYWQLFVIFTLLSGIGLMNINNLGNDVQALWRLHNEKPNPSLSSLQVSILSISSCTGRLISGIGSDLLTKKLSLSRNWWLFGSALIFIAAQCSVLLIDDSKLFAIVSILTGLGYGMLYGSVPSLLAYKFGVEGMSQNWGMTILGPVISGNILNFLYGRIYDQLSNGDMVCLLGRLCYQAASSVGLAAALMAAVISLVGIWKENKIRPRILEQS